MDIMLVLEIKPHLMAYGLGALGFELWLLYERWLVDLVEVLVVALVGVDLVETTPCIMQGIVPLWDSPHVT